jgi:hypothetical protein
VAAPHSCTPLPARDPNCLRQPEDDIWRIKQEENDDDDKSTVSAGRSVPDSFQTRTPPAISKVFRPGATSLPMALPAHSMIGQSPDEAHAAHARALTAQGLGPSMLGEWLACQEQYIGYGSTLQGISRDCSAHALARAPPPAPSIRLHDARAAAAPATASIHTRARAPPS